MYKKCAIDALVELIDIFSCKFRFLSLSDNEAGNIDLKKSAVIIISHLDRLVQPHLPPIETEVTKSRNPHDLTFY